MKKYIYCVIVLLMPGILQGAQSAISRDTALYSAMSMGTGWALTSQHIVTNLHVVNGMKNLRLVTSEQKEVAVELLLTDEKNDLAILLIKDKSYRVKPLPLALTKPRIGSQVFTIGYPHPNLMGTSPKLSSGFVSALNGLADDPRTLQVSVPVHAGNSGGPLLNMRGEVVGVITSKLSAQKMFEWTGDIPENVSYAIKINKLSSLVSELETDEQVKAGGAAKNLSLEELAETTLGSVIIVAGDGEKQNQEVTLDFLKPAAPEELPINESKKRVVVLSYVEPETFYYSENIRGLDDTLANYSRAVAEIMSQQIKQQFGENIEYFTTYGKGVNKQFFNLENLNFSKSICDRHNANNIVATFTEDDSGRGRRFRSVTYRMIDCSNYKEYKNKYSIYRNGLNDRFGYEVEFHTSFKDFMLKTPPYVSWLSQR